MERLYRDYRQALVAWAVQSYHCDEQIAIEVYQKAFTVMYMNVRSGRLTKLTSSLKTYIFSVARNLFRESFRNKNGQHIPLDETNSNILLPDHLDNSFFESEQQAHKREVVRQLLDQIGDPCRKLLRMLFIDGFKPKEVLAEMGYSDDRVARKRKSLCLKQMREITVALKNKED